MEDQSSGGKLPTLHLHMGDPKTGSSAIQAFLALNRNAFFDACGVFYPFTGNTEKAGQGRVTAGNGAEIARLLRQTRRGGIRDAVLKLKEVLALGRSETLLSSEKFASSPNHKYEELSAALAGDVHLRLILYVRPQVDHVRSAYLQAVSNRGGQYSVRQFFEARPGGFRPGARVAFLQDLFGPDNVTVRKYDRSALVGGDIIEDFMTIFNLSVDSRFARPPPANPSLDPEHYLYARAAGQFSQLNKSGKANLRSIGDLPAVGGLYSAAQPITGLQIMDVETAVMIAESRAADNELLDARLPNKPPGLNADNQAAIEAIRATGAEGVKGLSRLELLLLSRLTALEARVEALARPPADADVDDREADGVVPGDN